MDSSVPPIPGAGRQQAAGDLHDAFRDLRAALSAEIVGQSALIERLLIALLADGHLLVEGAPGLAKTSAIRALAARLEADFARVQFTPDLLPADLTGTEVWRPQDGRFEFQPGPIFHPLLLADEINRAPAKVQSALLEAMGERQVTVGRQTYALPPLFLVMATQNPIEQEGTFPLPEAQLDRFLMHVRISYPEAATEAEILRLARERARASARAETVAIARMPVSAVFAARAVVLDVHVAPAVERYLIELVLASRQAQRYDAGLARRIAWGASPRGSIALERCARAHAWLAGRDFVTPDDVRAIAADVLRHRILPSYEATAEGWDGDRLVAELLRLVPLP
jgi:MoxR-like ATPase